MTPQLLIVRPGGSPDAVSCSVQPASPSVAVIRSSTGLATVPVWLPGRRRLTGRWTSQVKAWVALAPAAGVAVTRTRNAPAVAGSTPVTVPVAGLIARPAGRPVAL